MLLNNERFMVPEALFRPHDIGLQQAGVAEVVVQAVSAAHSALQPLLYSNVVLTGLQLSESDFRLTTQPSIYSLRCFFLSQEV